MKKMKILAFPYNKAYVVSRKEYKKIINDKGNFDVAEDIRTSANKFQTFCITNNEMVKLNSFYDKKVLLKKK